MDHNVGGGGVGIASSCIFSVSFIFNAKLDSGSSVCCYQDEGETKNCPYIFSHKSLIICYIINFYQ